MELVLEGTEGVPNDAVLSIKIGEVKRQAPLSKIGQAFRFASSPASALPMRLEVLIPAVKPQSMLLDPLQEKFVIDLDGRMKIALRQQVAEEMQRPIPDVKKVAESRKLAGEQKRNAENAASYLESHGMVRTLQDLLHGLLVSQPEDPWKYLKEHLVRAEALAKKPVDARQASMQQPSGGSRQPSMQRSRSHFVARSKVDSLIEILKRTQKNLHVILPYLPQSMCDMLSSAEFEAECQARFSQLDKEKVGYLQPQALMPLVVELSNANHQKVGDDQVRKFAALFDANMDGTINVDEFTTLTQFVIVAAHLETEEGKEVLDHAQAEEERFKDFMKMLIEDKNRIADIVPFLPQWLVERLASDVFEDEVFAGFDSLDKDHSNTLTPDELIPLVCELVGVSPNSANMEKMKDFTNIFDTAGNGVIMRDEFLECMQFLEVMNFLNSTVEGQQVHEAALYSAELKQYNKLIAKLENDVATLPEVMSYLPRSLINELCCESFKQDCREAFAKLDTNRDGALDPAELHPIVAQFCEGHPMNVDLEMCRKFTTIFDSNRNGVLDLNEYCNLIKYMITLGYLYFEKDWNEDEVAHSNDRIEAMLAHMRQHCDRLDEILPMLPEEIQEYLLSGEFVEGCLMQFDELDKDVSGSLEPKELIPVVIDLCKAHPIALTNDQCLKFVDIFDTERTGVISRSEFLNLARFMIIMAYLETEEGRVVQDIVDLSMGDKKVEELLQMLQHDANAVHKIIAMLPEKIFDEVTSDEFVEQCHQRFAELDMDKNGVLSPTELLPIIVDLTHAHPHSVDIEQCERFAAIFDQRGDGVIRMDEFLDFARFLIIMSYMNSDEGRRECAEGLQVMSDSKRIEDLIQSMLEDRRAISKVIPYLPDDLRDELLGKDFTLSCRDKFQELDKDGNGSLDPSELYPIILDMTAAHHLSLDIDQCQRFTDIFDDEKTGVISLKEYVNFARFLMVMAFLQTSDGMETLELAASLEGAPSSKATQQAAQPPSPQAVGHMSVDLEYYQSKTERLQAENSNQRAQMLRMEEKMRQMEERMEKQEMKLRHAAIDLKSTM